MLFFTNYHARTRVCMCAHVYLECAPYFMYFCTQVMYLWVDDDDGEEEEVVHCSIRNIGCLQVPSIFSCLWQ
jgi:hypothetical protein